MQKLNVNTSRLKYNSLERYFSATIEKTGIIMNEPENTMFYITSQKSGNMHKFKFSSYGPNCVYYRITGTDAIKSGISDLMLVVELPKD